MFMFSFFFQAEDGIRDIGVTGVQTCALPISPVGVVGWGRTCMENLSRSMEGAGLDHLNFVQVYVDEGSVEEVWDSLDKARAVVCATITARRLRELGAPEDLEIIEEDRTLDKGGIEMLGRMLRELPRGERGTG